MIRYHLTITVYNAFFEWKLNARWKIDSVRFYDYDLFFEKVLQGMTYNDINKFKLNLFEWYKSQLSHVCVSQFVNGNIIDWYSIVSKDFEVPSHVIACCIPSRKIRDKFFEYDCIREKYYVKTDFIFYLRK